jgi:hypothetical protein
MIESAKPGYAAQDFGGTTGVLDDLSEVLREVGFSVRKRPARELTLRVYPNGFGSYPLLNPRLESSGQAFGLPNVHECFVFTVVSRGPSESLDTALASFVSSAQCSFVPTHGRHSGYTYHGFFVLPVRRQAQPAGQEVELASLKVPLKQLREFLQRIS